MIRWCKVPEIWCAMDGWTDGWKKWHAEVGAPPKKKKHSNIANLSKCQLMTDDVSVLELGLSLLLWKFALSQPYNGWIKMKAYSPTNFPSSSQHIGQYISHSYWKQFIVWDYHFSGPTDICLNSVIYTVE